MKRIAHQKENARSVREARNKKARKQESKKARKQGNKNVTKDGYLSRELNHLIWLSDVSYDRRLYGDVHRDLTRRPDSSFNSFVN
jgi:hypothetical protein